MRDDAMAKYVLRKRYLMVLDALAVLFLFGFTALLRYESLSYALELVASRWALVGFAVVARIAVYYKVGLYSRLWRHASVGEAGQILKAGAISSIVLVLLNYGVAGLSNGLSIQSASFFVIDLVVNIGWLGLSRLGLRTGLNWLVRHEKSGALKVLMPRRKVLIAGAGGVGIVVAKLIRDNPGMGYSLVGFVDDDPAKQGKGAQGYPVLGAREDIPGIVDKYGVREVIVAMPTAPKEVHDEIGELCSNKGISMRVIPRLHDLLGGTLSVDQMRRWRPLDRNVDDGGEPVSKHDEATYSSLLITGGAGFIGANFVHYMLEKYPNYKIIVYDKLTYAGNPDNLMGLDEEYPDRYGFVKGDICDADTVLEVMEEHQVDCIVNFAAESHVDRSLLEPDSFLRTNVYGTHTLLEIAQRLGIQRFHQISTDEVYGQVIRGAFSEEDPLETRSPYSASKAAADLFVNAYHVSFDVPATITRGSNNIGPYQYPEKAVPLFVTNALDDLPLPVYGDGLYVRDYQHVLDHCEGIDLVLHRGVPGEIYNLGGGNETTTLELARAILDRLDKPHSLIHLVDDRPGQDRRYSVNCSKIRALGWEPTRNFNEALDETIDWYVENDWWWRKIKEGDFQQYYEEQFSKRLQQAVQKALSS